MSHKKNDEPPTDNGKNELFSFSSNVSELMMAYANIQPGHEKHVKEMAFMESHASLFHMIHSVVKAWRKTAKYANTVLESQESDQINVNMPQDAVSEKEPGTAVDTQEDKETHIPVPSKHLSASKSRSMIFGRHQKHLGELSPAGMLPYLALISRCIPLPISDIESRCLKGQILCRIQYFTLRRIKKKLLPQPAPAKLPIPKLETTQGCYRKHTYKEVCSTEQRWTWDQENIALQGFNPKQTHPGGSPTMHNGTYF